MKFRITADKKFLQVVDATYLEQEQLEYSMTKKVNNYFIIKKKMPHWDGEIKFIDKYNRIPIGLWQEVKKMADKYNFQLEIEDGAELFNNIEYDADDFNKWLIEYFKDADIHPREYQSEGARRIFKYKNCTEEISTSGGKTLIAYMIFKYMLEKGMIKSMLYVVPNINLVTQSEEKFYEYEERCGKKPNWKSTCVFSGAAKEKDVVYNLVFGTYQSLVKKPLEYFKDFDAVCIDECLHPDTLITMEDFSKRKISTIKIGDNVWTKNEELNYYEIKEVEFVYKNLSKDQKMYEIELENKNIIKATGNHKVLLTNNTYKRVDELDENDEIESFLL